jgi:DNA-binding HxlR family transcriptional regulator
MSWQNVGDMPCSVARSLAVLGDRWTLLIIRSVFVRVRRFADLQAQLAIPKHVLSVRLSRLVDDGVLQKVQYQDAPPRHEYKLTEKGRDLYPVILMLTAWGDKWLDGGNGAPLLYRHRSCGEIFSPVPACSVCGERITARDVAIEAGPGLAAHAAQQAAQGTDIPPGKKRRHGTRKYA